MVKKFAQSNVLTPKSTMVLIKPFLKTATSGFRRPNTHYEPYQPPYGTTTASDAAAASAAYGGAASSSNGGQQPKKYIRVAGVMKINPEYKRWHDRLAGNVGRPSSSSMTPNNSSTQAAALPVVSNMDDHAQLNSDLGTNLPLAESTDATIEMMQEPEFSADAGMNPDTMVDELGSVLSKYEVPMGLMNKVRREEVSRRQ
jgi:hypothetical protein